MSMTKKISRLPPDPRMDATRYQFPYFFEKDDIWLPGKKYPVRVSNVYDPLKFWIIPLDKNICSFQNHLMSFYSKNGKQYKLSKEASKNKIYCVASVNNAYYRAIIIDKPQGIQRKIPIFLFDFGVLEAVPLKDLYYFDDKCYELPRYGSRARLSNLKPYKDDLWPKESAGKFESLVLNKIILATIDHIDPVEKIIYISTARIEQIPESSTSQELWVSMYQGRHLFFDNKDDDESKTAIVPEVLEFAEGYPIEPLQPSEGSTGQQSTDNSDGFLFPEMFLGLPQLSSNVEAPLSCQSLEDYVLIPELLVECSLEQSEECSSTVVSLQTSKSIVLSQEMQYEGAASAEADTLDTPELSTFEDIAGILIDEKLAEIYEQEQITNPRNMPRFLLPTFASLESGSTPNILKMRAILNGAGLVTVRQVYLDIMNQIAFGT
ncbi:hypothetical protein JTB14_003988 [Gonioctena quinquepunctata]|nr:hypothetical protein JTB14_003988 [Gonioctena quinquepunctata]